MSEKMSDLLKEAWEELEWFQRERMTRGLGRVLRVDRLLQNIESAGCKGDEVGVGGPLREFLDTFEAAREKLIEKVEQERMERALVEICRNTKPTKAEKAKDRVADFLEGNEPQTGWLPVAIAPEGVYVIAFGEYYGRRPMLAMKTGGVWYEGNKPIEPTHWMEIPPLP